MKRIIPLDNQHLPEVHPDIAAWAEKHNCTPETIISRCLYGKGDYSMEFSRDKAGNKCLMRVIPGHRWYADSSIPTQGPEQSDVMIIGKSAIWELSLIHI